MRDCDIADLDPCEIAYIKKLPGLPALSNVESPAKFSEYYKVVIGGPDPCNCGDSFFKNAVTYTAPDPNPNGYAKLPAKGDSKLSNNATFICKGLTITDEKRTPTDNKCRVVCVKVEWEEYIAPDLQSGELQLTEAAVANFPCQMKIRASNESIPAEFAEFQGFYDAGGYTHLPDFINADKVCQPLRQAFGSMMPVMNAAGVAFDPPLQKDENVTQVVVSRPYLQVAGNYIKRIKNKINCDKVFFLEFRNNVPTRGLTADPYSARVTNVSIADDYTIDSNRHFTWVSIEFTIKDRFVVWYDFDPQTDTWGELRNNATAYTSGINFGWDDLLLNRGLATLKYPGVPDQHNQTIEDTNFHLRGGDQLDQILEKGNPVTEPVMLSENGLTWRQEKDENDLSTGTVCTAGLRKSEILYIRWRKYEAVKFADNTVFPGFFKNGIWPADQSNGLPATHFPNWASSGDLSDTVLDPFGQLANCYVAP